MDYKIEWLYRTALVCNSVSMREWYYEYLFGKTPENKIRQIYWAILKKRGKVSTTPISDYQRILIYGDGEMYFKYDLGRFGDL